MLRTIAIALLAPALLLVTGCGDKQGVEPVNRWVAADYQDTDCDWAGKDGPTPAADMAERAAAYVLVDIAPDLSELSPVQREVMDELVAASRIMHDLFRVQATPCYDAMHAAVASYGGEGADALRRYFAINAGPWDRRQGLEPFLNDWPNLPGANYYPRDLTQADRDEITSGAGGLSGLFTMVRRDSDGDLVAIPYSVFFRPGLEQAAVHLQRAASLTENASLAAFLEARAAAFLSDDYFESDMLWMDLASPVEVTIGPYETYEDGIFGFKAAFESFVTYTDPVASQSLDRYKDELPWLENQLPIPDHYKNPQRGSESPIKVADLVYSAGDTRAGVQTIAFNLPNDEKVREAKGSKKVLLRNVMEAKFNAILHPIAEVLVARDQLGQVTAESFFLHTLWHEMSHGLGPGRLVIEGRETEVRLELQDTYSTIEEAKADIMGMWTILELHRAGRDYFPASITREQPVTFLAGLFRSVRFGISSAHGQANAIQFNYLLEQGAIAQDPDTGKFRVQFERFEPAIALLLNDLLMMQAEGNLMAARAMIERYAVTPPVLAEALGRLGEVPVDIQPVFHHYPQD